MKYELLYIVSSSFADAEVEGVQKKIAGIITEVGGQISRDESLGKIKLAYPINHVRHGTYILVHFEAEPEQSNIINNKLRLTEEVLRHTITKPVPGTENKKFELISYVAPLTTEGFSSTVKKKPAPAPRLTPPPPTKTEEVAPTMTVEELDKKLDEILESDVLKDI
ncbi:MAG: 30S ribosomal protein S6 [Candidatus Uhrbacteria bacterium]